jgi:hypothetical protein
MAIKEIPLSSPIKDKITWADRVCDMSGSNLLDDPEVKNLIEKFRKAALTSQREMVRSGIADECRDCDVNENGSCCGKGIEDRYTGILLLINRLLGIELPVKRYDPAGCFFLGNEGCLLLARQVICVNYLCGKITDKITPSGIAPLRDSEGKELQLLFLLTERIRAVLKQCPA